MNQRIDLVLSDLGWKLLEGLPPIRPENAADLVQRMRKKGLPADVVAAVVTQLQLRWEARAKFGGFADKMVLTRTGLQQASRLTVAALHAQRFRDAGLTRVADLGCGIGADSMAIAALGASVTLVDIDEPTLAAATANLRFFPHVTPMLADVTKLDVTRLNVDGIFADPARRDARGRISDPQRWSPPLSTVVGWAGQVKGLGIKVGPAIKHSDLPERSHTVWISVNGDLVEACIWMGDCIGESGFGRSAVSIVEPVEAEGGCCEMPGQGDVARGVQGAVPGVEDAVPGVEGLVLAEGSSTPAQGAGSGRQVMTLTCGNGPVRQVEPAPALGAYLFEPDAAFIRAGVLDQVCDALQARPVGPQMAYLTGDELPPARWRPFVDVFQVVGQCGLKPQVIRGMLGQFDIAQVEIKKRGVDIDPARLRQQIFAGGKKKKKPKKQGDSATLICTRTTQGRAAVLTKRLV